MDDRPALPNLVIAGVAKAGTTSLFAYLSQHPQICATAEKEVNFFRPLRHADGVLPPLDIYTAQLRHWDGEPYRLEASPSYAYDGPRVIAAMQALLTDPKVIIILRDPVARLWSEYTYHTARGRLGALDTFEDYVDVSRRRWESGTDKTIGDRLIGVSLGMYHRFLPDWLEAWGSDLRVTFAEQLAGDPVGILTDILRWLALDETSGAAIDLTRRNPTRKVRSARLDRCAYSVKGRTELLLRRAPALRRQLRSWYLRANTAPVSEVMSARTRQQLGELYAESVQQTAALLRQHGYRDLPDWLPAG